MKLGKEQGRNHNSSCNSYLEITVAKPTLPCSLAAVLLGRCPCCAGVLVSGLCLDKLPLAVPPHFFPGGMECEGFPTGFEWDTPILARAWIRNVLQPYCFLCQGGTRSPDRGCPRQKSCRNRGALCAWLLALSVSPPGCQHWPYIVASCSQQSFVPAEAQLGALWAFGCHDSKWLNPCSAAFPSRGHL